MKGSVAAPRALAVRVELVEPTRYAPSPSATDVRRCTSAHTGLWTGYHYVWGIVERAQNKGKLPTCKALHCVNSVPKG